VTTGHYAHALCFKCSNLLHQFTWHIPQSDYATATHYYCIFREQADQFITTANIPLMYAWLQ